MQQTMWTRFHQLFYQFKPILAEMILGESFFKIVYDKQCPASTMAITTKIGIYFRRKIDWF